jgi:hypothetical protein
MKSFDQMLSERGKRTNSFGLNKTKQKSYKWNHTEGALESLASFASQMFLRLIHVPACPAGYST